MGETRARGIRSLIALLIAATVGVGLAACTPTKPDATPATSSAAPSPSETPAASVPKPVPTLNPEGSAVENLAYFRRVGHRLLDRNQGAKGKTIVNYFVKAGFSKNDMEVTPDKTSIDLDAWNIEFSVLMNGTCLIGQAGNVRFQSFAAPVLATNRCLIGRTRTIDW